MATDVIRVDYERLDDVVRRFQQQAEVCEELTNRLRRQVDGLTNGGWEGEAAKAFLGEVNSDVFPALNRLSAALVEGGQVTQQVGQIYRQADEEVSRLPQGVAREGNASPVDDTQTGLPTGVKKLADFMGNILPPFVDGQNYVGIYNKHGWLRNVRGSLKGYFKDPVGKAGKVAGALSVVGGLINGYGSVKDHLADGKSLEDALSLGAGEATAGTLIRMAAYNPVTAPLALASDLIALAGGTDVIGKASKYVGKAANAASDRLSDGMVSFFSSSSAFDMPQSTISHYKLAGKKMPLSVARDVYLSLSYRYNHEAEDFVTEYCNKNSIPEWKVTNSMFDMLKDGYRRIRQ